jgi:hypothetical protein
MLQPAARGRAALPLAASDPIQASEAKAPLGRIAWRVHGTVDEDGLRRKRGRAFLTAPSITAAQAVEARSMCGLLGLDRSSRGPRHGRLSASASASASGLGGAHGPNMGSLPSVGCRGEMGHRGPPREAEPCLLPGRAAGAACAAGAARGRFARAGRIRGGFARWAWRPAGGEARARRQSVALPVWAGAYFEARPEWEARRGSGVQTTEREWS